MGDDDETAGPEWSAEYLGCWEQNGCGGGCMKPIPGYQWEGEGHNIYKECMELTIENGWTVFALDDGRNCMASADSPTRYKNFTDEEFHSELCLTELATFPNYVNASNTTMIGGPHSNSVYKLSLGDSNSQVETGDDNEEEDEEEEETDNTDDSEDEDEDEEETDNTKKTVFVMEAEYVGCYTQRGAMSEMPGWRWNGDDHDVLAECMAMTLAKKWTMFGLDD